MKKIGYNCRTFLNKTCNVVQIRVRWNNKSNEVAVTLGVFADPLRWDAEKQCAKRGATHKIGTHISTSREINNRILECLGYIDDVFSEFALKDEVPTNAQFKEKILALVTPSEDEEPINQEKTLDEIYTEFMDKCAKERNWTEKVHCKYQQVWTHLHCCDANVTLQSLDKNKMQKLRDWYVKNNYKNRTITKQFKILKSFLRWGVANGYPFSLEAIGYKPNLIVVPKTVTYLKYSELQKFADFKFPPEKEYLDKARDLFVFMSYTSLRYSDLYNLKPSHIADDTITMYTIKTHDRITIPLIDKAKVILEKYKDHPGKNGRLFPVPSDEKMNLYLKEAAKLAGLDKEFSMVYYVGSQRFEETKKMYDIIGCHDARRTFICISLSLGIPAEIVMKASGHSDYESMKPYIEVADETQTLEMEKWNKLSYKTRLLQLTEKLNTEQMAQLLKMAEDTFAKKLGIAV